MQIRLILKIRIFQKSLNFNLYFQFLLLFSRNCYFQEIVIFKKLLFSRNFKSTLFLSLSTISKHAVGDFGYFTYKSKDRNISDINFRKTTRKVSYKVNNFAFVGDIALLEGKSE